MSTVLANTITAVGGGGSTVKVNNDATFISEGGAITNTNLTQSLTKAYVNFNGTGTVAIRGSFNVSSLNDDGTGIYDFVYTNNMSNANYTPMVSGSQSDSDSSGQTNVECRRIAPTTSLYGVRGMAHSITGTSIVGGYADVAFCYGHVNGDLA